MQICNTSKALLGHRHVRSHRNHTHVCKAEGDSKSPSPEMSEEARKELVERTVKVLPKSGYFSLADPNQELYTRSPEQFDPKKKGGRFKPEFIWNTDWQKSLQMQESLERKRKEALEAEQKAKLNPIKPRAQAGAVSFSRLSELDRVDVDLTEVLRKQREAKEAEQAIGTVALPPSNLIGSGSKSRSSSRSVSPALGAANAKVVPLPRNDVKRLERASRSAFKKPMVTTVVSTRPEDEEAKAIIAAEELRRYEQEQAEQRLWVAAFSVLGAASTYASYGREICISYTLGALGGYLYLRLLARSVDGMGGQNVVAAVGSTVGNQRLLIPLILALGYNRWNTLYAEDYGLHLNLLAILVGFLTYKIAVVIRQGKQYMDDISASNKKESV